MRGATCRLGWCAVALAAGGCGFSGAPSVADRDAAAHDAAPGIDAIAIDAAAIDAPPIDAPPIDAKSCPPSYTLKLNGHSYRALAENNYASLVAACHADGQYVIAVNDASENTWALSRLVSSTGFVWIGLSFVAGAWTWDDGTPLGSGYENFIGAPPSSPAFSCVDVQQSAAADWTPFSCAQAHPTLCECNGP